MFAKAWRERWVENSQILNNLDVTENWVSGLAHFALPWSLSVHILESNHKENVKQQHLTSRHRWLVFFGFDLMNGEQYLTHIWARFGNLSLNDKWKEEEVWQTGLTCAALVFQAGSGPFSLPVYFYPTALFSHLLFCFWKTVRMYLIKFWVRGMIRLEGTGTSGILCPLAPSHIWPHCV